MKSSSRLSIKTKCVVHLIIIFLFAQSLVAGVPGITTDNAAKFYIKDGLLFVEYILSGSKSRKNFFVKIFLRRESNTNYTYEPPFVGDIGKGVQPSKNESDVRVAVWDLKKEPHSNYDDYYFEVVASPEGSSAWWWVLGGAIVAGAGIGVGVLVKSINDQSENGKTIQHPYRPSN